MCDWFFRPDHRQLRRLYPEYLVGPGGKLPFARQTWGTACELLFLKGVAVKDSGPFLSVTFIPKCFFVLFCFNVSGMWDLIVPRPGVESLPPAVEVSVLTTGPPGKSLIGFYLRTSASLWVKGRILKTFPLPAFPPCPLTRGVRIHKMLEHLVPGRLQQ